MEFLPNELSLPIVKWAARAAAVGLIWVLYVLAKRVFRYRRPAELTDDDIAGIRGTIRRYEYSALLPALVLGCAVGAGCWAGFHFAAGEMDRGMPAHLFYTRSATGGSFDGAWAIPALAIGVVAAAWTVPLWIRLRFGRRGLLAYRIYVNAKHGIDQTRAGLAATAVLVPLALFTGVLFLDTYTRVEEDRFVINEFAGLGEKSYTYSDVSLVAVTTHTRNLRGEESEFARLHVFFADGTHWTGSPAERYRPLAEFLERKTGKRVQIARHVEDLAVR